MSSSAPQWTTATTTVAQFGKWKDNAICGMGMWGSTIHTAAAIWKVIWKLRLCLMALT